MGVMYRLVDLIGFFKELQGKEHRFHQESLAIKLSITDRLIDENNRSITLQIQNGMIVNIDQEQYDVEVHMDISHLSSLIVGGTKFKTLYQWGLASVFDETYMETIHNLFRTEQPVCTKAF